jgi:Predicted AAA-ATPase/PD-(D/E)XK nuclease superfamily
MIKIPYGKSNFKELITEKFFYQDRTNYLQVLEDFDSSYLFFLRPRRFGKSLWLSMLNYYYGLQYKSEFDTLFGQLYIGKHPTPLANSYLVLNFEFSRIDTATAQGTFDGFLSNVLYAIDVFFSEYDTLFTPHQQAHILSQQQPNEVLKAFFNCHLVNRISSKIYILIDEYDHFANELISFDYHEFSNIVSKNGFVRKFYETIKTATGQGVVGRFFITGVSPVTVDSLTSGFNISTNISLSGTFHQMVGFEEAEVKGILAGIDIPNDQIPAILEDLRLWYNGYLFSLDAKHRVYNPDMVLYFAQQYKERNDYPYEMLDVNIASDYSKVRRVFNIGGTEENYWDILEELNQKGEITSLLVAQYSFDKVFSKDDLVSLLFYMGFLTIQKWKLGRYTFIFPNYVIKKLYADYFLSILQQRAKLPIDNRPVNNAIIEMAETGNPKLFFDQVALIVGRMSTRDSAHFNENTLKAIIISLLHQQSFYYIHSEFETDWQYMDVYLEAVRGHEPPFEVALELKYLKKSEAKALETTFTGAFAQLQGYLDTPKFNSRFKILGFVAVAVGNKLHWRLLKS